MRKFFLLSCLLLSGSVGFAGSGGGNGVDILPSPTQPGGGGGGNGVDILPIASPGSIVYQYSSPGVRVRVYRPTGSMSGLTIIVGPTVSTPDGDTCSVTVTGSVDSFGGTAVESQTCDMPAGENLSFGMTLKKRQSDTPSQSASGAGVDLPKDKRDVDIDVDVPFDELEDGDNTDDNIGSAYGFSPLLGWGSGPAYG